MTDQAFEPAELVVEFGAGGGIAVRQIEARDEQPIDPRLDVPALHVVSIAGQSEPHLGGLRSAGQDGDTVPALLAVPYGAVAGLFDLGARKISLAALSSCRHTTSGLAAASHRNNTGSLPFTPFTLKVAILSIAMMHRGVR